MITTQINTQQQRAEIWLNTYKDYIAFHADIKDSHSLALEAADRLLKEFDSRFNKIVIEPKQTIELKGGKTLNMDEARRAIEEAFMILEVKGRPSESDRIKATNWINRYFPTSI